ncbi:hypothetical protein GCM10010193_56010 [Kitasatospora atroaurantiaca]
MFSGGAAGGLTATSVDGCCAKWRIVAALGLGPVVCGVAESVAEDVDRLALEADSDVGIDGGGDAYVGVSEEFLDDDEFDALFEEQGGRRVAEVVEADAAEPVPAEQGVEVPGDRGSVDRGSPSGRVKT